MGGDARGGEGIRPAAGGDYEIIIGDVEGLGTNVIRGGGGFKGRQAVGGLGVEADGDDVRLVVCDAGARLRADRFFGEVEVEETAGGGGEQGRVGAGASRGNYGYAVGRSVEVGGEIETGPAGADD